MRTQLLSLSRPFPLLSLAALALGVASLATACSNDTAVTEEGNETTAASGTAEESDSEGPLDTSDTDIPEPIDTGDTGDTDDGNFISDEGPEGETGTPGNLGDMCAADSDCAEDLFCNGVVGLGSVCSECSSDADCDGGNCTFTGAYFACGDGSLGQMCESDASCTDGAYCTEVVNLGGLVNGNFCSECKTDAECADGQLCAPTVEFTDIMNFSGQRTCIDPGTQPNDQLCDVDGAGDEQCDGYCTKADLMGFIEVGICGECETDAECDMTTCMPSMVGFEGFSGSVCG